MLRLDKVIKPWKESLALNDHINLDGFWNETAFLTKTGDLDMVLSVPGVDYESLDHSEQDYAVKRLEAALTAFGPGFHVYQYLFKSNPDIPFAKYDDPIAQIEVLDQQGQFTFFRRLLNYDDRLIAGKLQSTQFRDYQVVNSDIESEHDQLRVGDYIGRVLTMKEAITETRPLVLDALLKIPANFPVVTEWTPLPADKARKEVNKRRRHFNMSKTGFVSQMGNDATKTNPPDVLVDESKQADIENLGDCLRALGDGQSLGDFSLTICAVWPGVIWSLKNGTRSTRGRVHRRLQCGRQSVCRDLQPAQRLFRHPSGQQCDQRPQAVSAEHELRRPVFSLYDPARRKDERASRYGVSGCDRNRQQHAILSEPA